MAEERFTPRPVRSQQLHNDERIQPTRVAPPPPTAQSSVSSLFCSSFEGLHNSSDALTNVGLTDLPSVSSASSSFSSAVEDSRPDDIRGCAGTGGSDETAVRAPPRPRHTFNKVARAESLLQQRQDHPSGASPTPVNHAMVDRSAAASVVASLRDRFEARRRANPDLPDASGTTSPDSTPETLRAVAAKPNVPPKPGGVTAGKDDGQIGRRVKGLQRQPAFREFDVVNARKLSATEPTEVT